MENKAYLLREKNLLLFLMPFIAFLEVAEATGVVEMADFLAEAYDATDAFDRQHKRRVGKTDTAGVAVEQREKQLLLRDVPTAIAW